MKRAIEIYTGTELTNTDIGLKDGVFKFCDGQSNLIGYTGDNINVKVNLSTTETLKTSNTSLVIYKSSNG